MTYKRLRFVIAAAGRKPGKSESLGLLLDPEDIDGDAWRILDERTWRTGQGRSPTVEWATRARSVKSVSGWRSFEQSGGWRWLWLQASPLATPADVTEAMAEIPLLSWPIAKPT